MNPLPLDGIRIIEPGQVWALPYAIAPLATYGAEVIKVESTVRPDSSRGGPQPANRVEGDAWNHGGAYHEVNRNKLGITLDLNTQRGKDLFKELVSLSDVVAQNFPPRVMRNFGLDYSELKKIKPDIIVLDSTAYGSTGPWQNYIGYGSSIQAVTGLTYLTGYEDGGPLQGGILYNDILGALTATYAILLAIAHRERTGEGQWIDLSQYQAGVVQLGEAFMDYTMNERTPTRRGNSHPNFAPYGVYPCSGDDSWVAITITSDAEWMNFRGAVGEKWAGDPELETTAGRLHHRKKLDADIGKWTSSRDKHQVMLQLQTAGVACGAVNNTREITTDSHLAERDFFRVSHHPSPVGPRPHAAPLFNLMGVQLPPDRLAPTLGQHNRYVLCDLLGYKDEEYRELEGDQVIGQVPVNPAVTPPPDPEDLLRMGFLAEYDTDYKNRLGLEPGEIEQEKGQ